MATVLENIQTLQSIKSDIKNAIIEKGGSATDAFGGYAQAIKDLPSGGDTDIEDGFVTKKLSCDYINNRVSSVGKYAFYTQSELKTVSMNNVTNIGSNAFLSCTNLTTANFPKCSYISDYAFLSCNNLTTANFPKCSYIAAYVFQYCSALTSVSFPECKTVGFNGFSGCSSLVEIYLPNCSYIGNHAFNRCTNLRKVWLYNVSSVTYLYGSSVFAVCTALTSIIVPESLVDTFKTHSVWSWFSGKIVAYEG